jgi:alpha-tubulin suppressor-like RCC1 family protein
MRAACRTTALAGLALVAASATMSAVPGATAASQRPTTVSGWGGFDVGQSVVPAGLAGRDVVGISAGDEHSLALTRDGAVTGWGWNGQGQAVPPADLASGATPATMVDAGVYHSLAVLADGSVRGWGAFGDTDEGQVDVPAELRGPSPATAVQQVAAGTYHSVALTRTGRVVVWGALGRHQAINAGQRDVPTALTDGTRRVVDVAAGYLHSVALDSTGHVTVWGSGTQHEREVPEAVRNGVAVDVEAHGSASLAVLADGTVHGWGDSGTGTLDLPAELDGQRVVAVDMGAEVAMALTSTGRVITWGDAGSHFPVPAQVAQLGPITGIAAGGRHLLAMHATPVDPPVVVPPAPVPAPVRVATSLALSAPGKVVQGRRATVRVTLRGIASGPVVVTDKGRTVARLTGSGTVRLRLTKGRHVLVASYAGSAQALASTSAPVRVKVVAKKKRQR